MNDETDVLELHEIDAPKMEVVKLNITDTEIARLKAEYYPLVVNGIEDKAGLAKVYAARQDVKKKRVGLVKYADGLKEKALAWQRKVNEEKNRVVGELEAIEAHLQFEEDKIQKEKERIAAEKEIAEQAALQLRVNRLAEYGYRVDLVLLKSISDEQFAVTLASAQEEYQKELHRKEEEKKQADLREHQLQAERKELTELREKQAAAQKIIDDNNNRICEEQEKREAELKAAKQKIADEQRAIDDEKQRVEKERVAAIQLEEIRKDEAEKTRLKIIADNEKLKLEQAEKLAQSSDKVKFQTVIDQLQAITIPEMKSKNAKALADKTRTLINTIVEQIKSGI